MDPASGKPVQMSIEAVVIRKDGTRQDLGTVSYWHRNPLMRLLWKTKQMFRKKEK